jgi:hypothetical protein
MHVLQAAAHACNTVQQAAAHATFLPGSAAPVIDWHSPVTNTVSCLPTVVGAVFKKMAETKKSAPSILLIFKKIGRIQ